MRTIATAAAVIGFLSPTASAQTPQQLQDLGHRCYGSPDVAACVRDGIQALRQQQGPAAPRQVQPQNPARPPRNNVGSGAATTAAPDPPRDPPGSDRPPPARENYTGFECRFFTRPYIERTEISVSFNRYANGAEVCHNDWRYRCVGGYWQRQGQCPRSAEWQRMRSDILEGTAIPGVTVPMPGGGPGN